LRREKKRVLSRITRTEAELQTCEYQPATLPTVPPGLRDFGTEISQGIGGYNLVAGKDTIVRAYVGAKQPVAKSVAAMLT
jgi:hypothetical protein